MRRLQIGTEVWEYLIGRCFAVIRSPKTRKKTSVTLSVLTGRSVYALERGLWKKTSDGMVGPSHVRAFILAHAAELHRGHLS
jgi:hypothetical protein